MPFSVSDILDAIKDMSAFSAAGPDKFPVAILKECGELLAPIIHKLWCASLETGIIAEKFKSQAVIPIFKGGSKAIPANYRPVSLTSHIIKLFERVVRKKMISFISLSKNTTSSILNSMDSEKEEVVWPNYWITSMMCLETSTLMPIRM